MFELLFSSAYAQEAADAASKPSPLMSFAPFVVIFAIFYFLMIRPQKKKMQVEKSMLDHLSKGDEVYTKSGVLGTVAGLTDKLVTLEIAEGVKMKILRGNIGGLSAKLFEKPEDKKK